MTILFCLVAYSLFGQAFSNRYDTLEEGAYDTSSIIYNEDGLTIVGSRLDANLDGLGYFDRVVFSRIDEEGLLVYENYLYEPYHNNRSGFFNRASKVGDDYVFAGFSRSLIDNGDGTFSADSLRPQITRVDNSGNIVWRKDYFISNHINQFFRAIPALDGGIIALGQSYLVDSEDEQVWLVKVDDEGEVVWSKEFGVENSKDFCTKIEVFNNTYLITGTYVISPGTQRAQMYQVDSAGNVLEEFTNFNLEGSPLFSYATHSISNEEFFVRLPKILESDDLDLENHVGLMNADFDMLWTVNVDLNPNDNLALYNADVNDDGDLIFLGRTQSSEFPANTEVVVGKVSYEGELEWIRSFVYSEYGIHILKGLDTYENRIALSGFMIHLPPDNFEVGEQDMWILKLDEHGCLIENCHTGVEEIENIDFKIFPNPTSDYLYADLSNYTIGRGDAEFVLHNSFGRELQRVRIVNPEATYVFPMHDLADGMYFLSLFTETEKLNTQKITVRN